MAKLTSILHNRKATALAVAPVLELFLISKLSVFVEKAGNHISIFLRNAKVIGAR
jgi:hypothetical protein